MTLNISSERPVLENFDDHYEHHIFPYLQDREGSRRSAVVKFLTICVGAVIVAAMIFFLGPFGGGNIQAAFFALIVGGGTASWQLKRAGDDISHGLFRLIADFFGFSYAQKIATPGYVPVFQKFKLLPRFDQAEFEDEICGIHEKISFTLCEGHLKRRSQGKNRSMKTVFHGQLLLIDYEKRFRGETVLLRDAGIFNRFGRPDKRFQQVGLASSAFEKIYEAWSTDQVEARDILDPLVLERFEELDRLFSGAKLAAAFAGGQVMITLSVGDKLNMGSMFESLTTPKRVKKIIEEFDLIFDLIDVLTKRVDGKLNTSFAIGDVRAKVIS